MTEEGLPDDVTVATIVATLDKPVEYLRGMLQNMQACRKQHGSARVSIGTTGRGVAPHYRVAPDEDCLELLDNNQDVSEHFVAYHGRSHKRMDWGLDELQVMHWSYGSMTFDEIRNLLGRMRTKA
jgi:hypothetical protein